jgi:hypothetical protein
MSTLTGHQQLLETALETQVSQHYDLNKKMKHQEKDIHKLYRLLNTLHNFQSTDPTTPTDRRRHKKSKQRTIGL